MNNQETLVRESLLNSVFKQYQLLREMITALPIDQAAVPVIKGLSYMEDGAVWIKEAILHGALHLVQPENEVPPPPSEEELPPAA